jgi:hypothetical protein
MELFAAKRVKKKEDRIKSEKIRDEEMNTLAVPSLDQRIKLDHLFGFPDPPEMVYALGSDESVKIWWISSTDDPEVVSWEIQRYRFEKTNEWKFKGSLEVKYLKHMKQISFNGLQNGYEVQISLFASLCLPSASLICFSHDSTNSLSRLGTPMA